MKTTTITIVSTLIDLTNLASREMATVADIGFRSSQVSTNTFLLTSKQTKDKKNRSFTIECGCFEKKSEILFIIQLDI